MEERTIAAIQEDPKFHQGMNEVPLSISENIFCGSSYLNDQESTYIANLEQQYCTTLCNMETFKEEINHHPHEPFLNCISYLRLGFEDLKGRMEDSRHLEVRNPFSFLDDPFSMRTPLLKEKLLPATDP